MRPHRFSMLGLIAAVLFFGLSFAGMSVGSVAGFKACYSLTLLALLLSLVLAKFWPSAFWYGFAVFGWGYFLFGYGAWQEDGGFRSSLRVMPNPNLPTSDLVHLMIEYATPASAMPGRSLVARAPLNEARDARQSQYGFGHLMLTAVFGYAGGLTAYSVAGRRRESQAGPQFDPDRDTPEL